MPKELPASRLWARQSGRVSLYNAKRKIKSSRGISPAQAKYLESKPEEPRWKQMVSPDVAKFIKDFEGRDRADHPRTELLPEQKQRLLTAPAYYFSRPQNVPNELRQQVYFPDFTVTLLRTPHLGPRFAQFSVPLWFGKLDLKSYLKNAYDVDVNHVRSFIVYQSPHRASAFRKGQRQQLRETPNLKKMTAELLEPFIWPAEVPEETLNTQDFDKQRYWKSMLAVTEAARAEQEQFASKPNLKYRRSIAEQARALLEGREKWSPTWQDIPSDVRVMQPYTPSPPSPQLKSP